MDARRREERRVHGPARQLLDQAGRRPLRRRRFHKDRVGLCEIAFWAETRAQVDDVARGLVERGVTLLDPPREYDYVPGYYAVFFPDPDGLKLEIVHLPV